MISLFLPRKPMGPLPQRFCLNSAGSVPGEAPWPLVPAPVSVTVKGIFAHTGP